MSKVSMLSPQDAADLFLVDLAEVERWIEDELIPFARLGDGSVIIPLGGLQMAIESYQLLPDVVWGDA